MKLTMREQFPGENSSQEQVLGVGFNSLHIIQQDSRYAKQDGKRLDDLSLCSSGNIAVSGHSRDQSYVCIYGSTVDNSDSRDKPTLLYHKQFTDKETWRLRISFIKPNCTEIVTCLYNEVQVIDYNRDVVLRSRKVNGRTMCLSVSESQIFIGLSDIVNIYDNDLNRIKSIRLKGIRDDDWPKDIAAAADRLYVCTEEYGRAIAYSQDSGSILTEYTKGQYRSKAWSMAVNIQYQIVAVLWYRGQVAVYSFNSNNCLVVFNVGFGVSRIRISDQGRIVTGNIITGRVKIYEFAQFFTYDNLKATLSSLLSECDLKVLLEYFKISEDSLIDSSDGRSKGKAKYANLLHILEERGILNDEDFHQLKEAFCHLGSHHSRMVMSFVDFYQEYAEKAILSPATPASVDAEGNSGDRLQLNGFSADWSVVDMSLGPGPHEMVVLSGYDEASGKTSLDCIHEKDSVPTFPWMRTREFDEGNCKKAKRFVSFIDESQIVSCCHNMAEIINLKTNELKCKACLPRNDSASCVTVRNKNIYIGFEQSRHILVLDAVLQEKMKIKLKDNENMWPLDLAVSIGRLLVCLKNWSSSKVFLFTEVDGEKLLEYRIDVDKAKAPRSVAVHEESDLAAILWDIKDEDEYEDNYNYYDMEWQDREDRTYRYLSLHSLSQGYCLSVVSVGFSVCDFDCECYEGCSSGKKVRIDSGCVAVLDTMSGVKFFDMKKMFTSHSVKTALCQLISSDDCQELMCEETEGTSDKNKEECNHSDTQNDEDNRESNCSKTKNSDGDDGQNEDSESELDNSEDDEEIRLSARGMHVVDIVLAILTAKEHMKSDDVSVLKEEIRHTISSHCARSVEQVVPERNIEPFVRFKETFLTNYSEVSFGPCDKIVTVKGDDFQATAYCYSWHGKNHTQPTLVYFREFSGIDSKLLASYLDENKVVTFSNDVIEVADFSLNGKTTKSLELKKYGKIVTCMTAKDEEIFTGFKSSEVVVFDSDLKEKRNITIDVKDDEWPVDMTVAADRLFVCTDGSFSRALSFSKDGRKITEYKYLPERFQKAYSITVDEHHDLIVLSWGISVHLYYCKGEVITLHSLSKGHCLALLDCDNTVRFSFKSGLPRIHKLNGEFYLLDQTLMFEGWLNLIASIATSPGECEKLQEFFQICDSQVISKAESMIGTCGKLQENIQHMRGLVKVLKEKGVISPGAVHDLKRATDTFTAAYTKKLCEPLEHFIQFSSETRISERPDSVPARPSDNIAESLLQLQHSVHSQSHNACLNTIYQQGNLSQSYRGQSSSQGQVSSSLPYTNNAPVTESLVHGAGKRAHAEGDHSATDNGLLEKRAKTGEQEPGTSGHMISTDAGTGETSNTNLSQLIRQIHRTPSFLQLMEGDQPPILTNPHVYQPVSPARSTRPTQLETLPLPMVAQPTISHQPLVDTTSHQMPIVQVGLQHTNQVLRTPYQVGEGVESQTNLHIGCPTSVSQSHVPIMTQQQTMRQAGQPNIPQILPQPRYSLPSLYRQPILSPQLQPVGQPVTQQREPCVMPNLPTSSYHQNGRSQGQDAFLELRQNVQQQTHNSVHSLISSVAEVVNPNTGPNTGEFTANAMSQSPHQPVTEKSNQVEQREHINAQGNIQQIPQLEPPNSVPHEVQATGRGVEQLQSTIQPGTQHSIGQTNRTEWESVPTTSQQISEEMTSVVQSCVQRVVTPFLKDISDKLGHLLGSSRTAYSQQDIPGTSSQSNNNALDSAAHSSHSRDSEHDKEVTSAWESLSEYNRMSLQAFRGMTDDRAELVRRLVEMVFTEEERRNQNCFGKSGKQKLDENKLRKIRHITFYLCPIITKKTDIDKLSLEDVEWKRLCEVIDKANRHLREKLKRQGRER